MNGLIGLTDSFRTTAAGSSVLPQRLSYEFDSQCQSVFLVFHKNRCQKLQQRKGIKAKGINMDDIGRKPVDGRTASDSTELTHEMISELREAFSLFDRDGDGTITREELGTVMDNLGMNSNPGELDEMIKEVDEDGSGAVDFDEFCLLMQRKIAMDTKQELFELFSVWDESGEGIIEANELRCLLNRIPEKLTKREIDSLVNQADTKKNGKIKFQDFVNMLS